MPLFECFDGGITTPMSFTELPLLTGDDGIVLYCFCVSSGLSGAIFTFNGLFCCLFESLSAACGFLSIDCGD